MQQGFCCVNMINRKLENAKTNPMYTIYITPTYVQYITWWWVSKQRVPETSHRGVTKKVAEEFVWLELCSLLSSTWQLPTGTLPSCHITSKACLWTWSRFVCNKLSKPSFIYYSIGPSCHVVVRPDLFRLMHILTRQTAYRFMNTGAMKPWKKGPDSFLSSLPVYKTMHEWCQHQHPKALNTRDFMRCIWCHQLYDVSCWILIMDCMCSVTDTKCKCSVHLPFFIQGVKKEHHRSTMLQLLSLLRDFSSKFHFIHSW